MLTGNKGEWSELYVLLSLLAEGELFQSDFELKKDEHNVYKVIKAFKNETKYRLEFDRQEEVQLYKISNNSDKTLLRSYTYEELQNLSDRLLNGILTGKGKSFRILPIEPFLEEAKIQKLKAEASVKADMELRIYDHRLAKETELGFSIKSLLGGQSTLFNTGPGNNFIFKIKNGVDGSIDSFNERTLKPGGGKSKITARLKELAPTAADIEFIKTQSRQLWRNLKMIDGDLPEILAWAQYYRWTERESKLLEVCEILENRDPLNFYDGYSNNQRFYEYKIKRFLTEAAMGMTPEKPWLGEYDMFGGVIIVKEDGDIVCFHIYDFNLFRNYLLSNTKFEQASTGESNVKPGTVNESSKKNNHYGWLYKDPEHNDLRIKLNLQIRFI